MAQAAVASSEGISRREFLYYVWGASIALFAAEFTGLLVWFMIPRFREGEFGGIFRVPVANVPGVNAAPVANAEGRFWLVNLDSAQANPLMYQVDDEEPVKGIAAIYSVCTHLGCIYAWNDANNRFECPCHGSKYRLDGRRIESPAPRSLDRFRMQAVDGDGNVLAESGLVTIGNGEMFSSFDLPAGTVELLIDTGALQPGTQQTLLCEYTGTC